MVFDLAESFSMKNVEGALQNDLEEPCRERRTCLFAALLSCVEEVYVMTPFSGIVARSLAHGHKHQTLNGKAVR